MNTVGASAGLQLPASSLAQAPWERPCPIIALVNGDSAVIDAVE